MTTSDDDLPTSTPPGEHRLSPHLSALGDAAEALQTWSSDLASRLAKEGAGAEPSAAELGEGRRLGRAVQEALEEVVNQAVWEG